MDIDNLTRGGRIVLLSGALLVLDLISFPWHRGVVLTPFGAVMVRATGIETPNAFYGRVALLLTLVMITQIVLSLTTVRLPKIPVSWGQVHFVAGVIVLVMLVLKLVADATALSTGAILAIPIAAVLAYGAFTLYQESRTGGSRRGYGGY